MSDRSGPSGAEAAFSEFLRRREGGEAVDFEAFCAERAAMADALRALRSLHEHGVEDSSAGALDEDRRGPLREGFQALLDLGDAGGRGAADLSARTLEDLASRSPHPKRYTPRGGGRPPPHRPPGGVLPLLGAR
jgi:hypothetical protein